MANTDNDYDYVANDEETWNKMKGSIMETIENEEKQNWPFKREEIRKRTKKWFEWSLSQKKDVFGSK